MGSQMYTYDVQMTTTYGTRRDTGQMPDDRRVSRLRHRDHLVQRGAAMNMSNPESDYVAVELTVYLEASPDVDKPEMDRLAAALCRRVVDMEAGATVVAETPAYLVVHQDTP